MITLKAVSKTYVNGSIKTEALKEVSLTILEGDFVVILGPSGSGKSTLLNVISGLDKVSSGTIYFRDQILSDYKEEEMIDFRRKHLGFIFQQYNLLQNLTVYENIQIGSDIGNEPKSIKELLSLIGLEKDRHKYPYQLSGGEQQRVSVARSLAKNPDIIFCDEPTGSLDEDNARTVLTLLEDLNQNHHKTIVLITHNTAIGAMADQVIKMNSGRIVETIHNKKKIKASEVHWG
jgi:putative ABC transport system ATP-binding protein